MKNAQAFSAAAATLLIASGSSAARAGFEKAPSIDTPPAVSKAALEKVRADGHGQFAVPDGFRSGFVETEGIRLHCVSFGAGLTREDQACDRPIIGLLGGERRWRSRCKTG